MHCLSCGYNLNALPNPCCPECGRAFDPLDSKSWGNARVYKFGPIAKVAGLLCFVGGALPALIAMGGIAMGLYDAFVLVMLWMYAAVPFLILLFVWSGCLSACEYTPSRRAKWLAVILLFFNLSLLTEWPIYVSFYLHRPAMNQLVERHRAGESISLPAQIGLFRVYDIETIYWGSKGTEIIDFTISSSTGNPDHLVYGMSDERYGRAATPFNIWSDRRLDADWHIVHED